MDSKCAFEKINNLDVREPLRKYQPQWSTVVISYDGDIIDIIKHKEEPDITLNKNHLSMYPETIQITAWQGRFISVDQLLKAVNESKELGNNY